MATTTITIRHVPDEVRNELAARAARSGRSLQEYLLLELIRLHEKPNLDEFMAQVQQRKRRTPQRVNRRSILADRDAGRR